MKKIGEECGVFGVYSPEVKDVGTMVYYGLFSLQHRGQESCGIVVNDDGLFASHKALGLVGEVFSKDELKRFPQGRIAVGHVRYGTTGGTNRANCQPIEVNHMKGRMALAHNGNLTNSWELRRKLEMEGAIFHTTSDTETIAYVITKARLKTPSIESAVDQAMDQLEGAYSLVVMSPSKMIAVRDPRGFRPLCYGKCPDGTYITASESCALEAVGAAFIRELEPGEILVFDEMGVRSLTRHCGQYPQSLCVFEYIYFARPDSVIDQTFVHHARIRAGECLAESCPADADLVAGVPDSGLDAALGYSRAAGIPYGMAFIKNRYIARTFISPGQDSRMDQVRVKLNPISDEVRGKRIVLVDDSIVRGTTSRQIIRLLKNAGAKEVHMRVSAPPFLNPCFYGTDIDSRENLIACRHTIEEIREMIGADSLGYLRIEDLKTIAGENCRGICSACFTGCYPGGQPEHTEKNRFERRLSERREKE